MKVTTKGITQDNYGTYKFRARVPLEAQEFFGRSEINKSLQTKDAKRAEAIGYLLYNDLKEVLKVIKMHILSNEKIQELVDKFIRDSLYQDKLDRALTGFGTVRTKPSDLEAHEGCFASAMESEVSSFLGDFKEDLANCNYTSMIDTAKDILEPLGIEFDSKEPSHSLLLQSLMRGTVEVLEEAKNRYRGEFNPKYDVKANDSIVTTPSNPQTDQAPRKPKKAFKTYKDALTLFKRFYEAQKIGSQTKLDTYNTLDRLLVIMGEDTFIEDTNIDDMMNLQETIEGLPNLNKDPYNKMSFKEILALSDIPNEHIISDNRVQGYIKHIKKFFTFCHEEGIIQYNPSLRLSVVVEGNKKDSFNDEEMKHLISIVSNLEDDLKYLYLSYIYTGMRREELYNSVILDVEGIKYFSIQKGKNTSSIRGVPLHDELIKLGLDNDKLQKAKTLMSFNGLGVKFNESIKTQVTDSTKKTLHSLRHTVATKLQNVGVSDETIRAIIGHAAQDTLNKVYTSSNPSLLTIEKAKRLKDALNKLVYI